MCAPEWCDCPEPGGAGVHSVLAPSSVCQALCRSQLWDVGRAGAVQSSSSVPCPSSAPGLSKYGGECSAPGAGRAWKVK